jgi:nitrate ABC transporter permease subunit
MSLCINPQCPHPDNPDNILFCQACGSELMLQGRYRVLSQLGGGGFGLTFEVQEVKNNTSKVLKVLTNNQPKAVELFQQEAEVLSYLHHPGIPLVDRDSYFIYHPRNSQNPIHCLVMEKVEGMDLQEWMFNRGMHPIDQTLAVEWLRQLVNILEQVHQQQFFHRDIKPSNIMLRASGEVALIDFGTARQVTQTVINQQGGVTGVVSAGYTPPEQINNNAVPQSDFFALGRTFVFLLTGKEPTSPDIYDYSNDELSWRNNIDEKISSQFADLIDQMMSRSPNQRPENTQVIIQQLEKIDPGLNPQKKVPTPTTSTQNTPIAVNLDAPTSSSFPVTFFHKIKLVDILLFIVSLAIFLIIWQFLSLLPTATLPGPFQVIRDTWFLILYPFYDKGGVDKGLFWQVLASLQRVLINFSLAAIVGIPLGYILGMYRLVYRAFIPLLLLLDAVPVLAWVPIGLAAARENEPAASIVIFIAAILPIILNTAFGAVNNSRNNKDILVMAPYIFTGFRLSIRSSWQAIIAAEIVMSGIVGIGFFVWNAYQNNSISEVILALIWIGIVGFALEQSVVYIGSRIKETSHLLG